MVIFYEIRSEYVRTIDLNHHECPHCHSTQSLKLNLFRKYTWFIVSILPAGKTGIVECSNCNAVLKAKEWTPKIASVFNNEKSKIEYPLGYYKGSIGIALVFIVLFTMMKLEISNPYGLKDDTQTIKMGRIEAQHINPNDLLYVSVGEGRNFKFGVLKVIRIESDKVALVTMSNQKFGQFKDIHSLKATSFQDSDFSNEAFQIDLDYLKKNKVILKLNNLKNEPALMFYAKVK